jgi:hypothetical protein
MIAPADSRTRTRAAPSLGICRRVVGALTVASALACGDPTGPPEPFEVTLTTGHYFGPVYEDVAGQPRVRCGFRVIANATGPGRADWKGGVFRYFIGPDRTVPIDSSVVSEADLAGAWSLDSISRARPDTSFWQFEAGLTFEVELAFQYQRRNQASAEMAAARYVCGAKPTAGAAAPTLTLVDVRTSDPDLEVGDTVSVTYDVTGVDPLWRSGVVFSGPFEAERYVADSLATSSRRTVRVVVPPRSRLHLPLQVLLIADDIGLRRRTALTTTTIRVVDRAPPTAGGYSPGGRFATSGNVSFVVYGVDNNGIRSLVWELDGEVAARDSIILPSVDNVPRRDIVLAVRPEWAGKVARLRVRTYDEAGLPSLEYVSSDSLFRFHTGFSGGFAERPWVIESQPSFTVFDQANSRVFATWENSTITSVDLANMSLRTPFTLTNAGAIGVTANGDSLVVGTRTSRTLRFVSPNDGTVLGALPITAVETIVAPGTNPDVAPDAILVLPNGRLLVHLAGIAGVVEIFPNNGIQRLRRDFQSSAGLLRMVLTPDGQRVLFASPTCLRWLTIASGAITECAPGIPDTPWPLFSPAADRVGIGSRIYGADLLPIGPADKQGISIPDEDGIHHWNADTWEGRLYKVRTADGVTVSSTPLLWLQYRMAWRPGTRELVLQSYGRVMRYDLTGR